MAVGQNNKKVRVFILGSCVSRDVFNQPHNFKIVNYSARTSFASLFSKKFGHEEYGDRLPSRFQATMLKDDLAKSIRKKLCETEFDLLLVDFIDERFNLIENQEAVCSKSTEFVRSGILKDHQFELEIESGSERFMTLWIRGWEEFLRLMMATNNIEKVVLNKVYWAKTSIQGASFSPSYTDEQISKMNAFLDKLYTVAEKLLAKENVIQAYKPQQLVADASHRWGSAPFHYDNSYYARTLALLTSWCRESFVSKTDNN